MPALSPTMTEGVINKWLVKVGDIVKAGDIIAEIETDKATMEVEAQKEGYLSKIKVDEGSEVPVGQLLALISDTNEDSHNDQTDLAESDSFETIEPYAEPINDNSIENEVQNIEDSSNRNELSTRSTRNKAASTGVKVLASPKAKLAAKEMGFDLAELRNAGIAEPFHFADLARVPQSSSFSSIYLQVSAEAFEALILKSETVKRSLLFSKFTSSAWSFVFEESVLELIFKDTNGESYVETTAKEVSSNDVANTITLIDLCDTRISAYETGSNKLTLSFSQLRNEFTICFSFNERILQFPDAVKFLNELGARIEDPVLQLI